MRKECASWRKRGPTWAPQTLTRARPGADNGKAPQKGKAVNKGRAATSQQDRSSEGITSDRMDNALKRKLSNPKDSEPRPIHPCKKGRQRRFVFSGAEGQPRSFSPSINLPPNVHDVDGLAIYSADNGGSRRITVSAQPGSQSGDKDMLLQKKLGQSLMTSYYRGTKGDTPQPDQDVELDWETDVGWNGIDDW
ncbi:MAG: hypothetical protein Q9209_007959 [Squamulea sp. 1 TL-2023]